MPRVSDLHDIADDIIWVLKTEYKRAHRKKQRRNRLKRLLKKLNIMKRLDNHANSKSRIA